MTANAPGDKGHPLQAQFFILGIASLVGCVVAGLENPRYAALCIALAFLSGTFFALHTWIHLRH